MSRDARNSRFGVVALGLVALLWGTPAAWGQDDGEPEAEFEGRVEVEEVLLDVVVTDRKGNTVIGLAPEDFVVEEDGEPVAVESATFYSSSELLADPEPIEDAGGRIDQVPRDRYFILLFEDQKKHQPTSVNLVRQQIQAGRDAKRWIAESLAPSDWVAVLGYDFKLKVYEDFTRDRSRLTAAIDDAIGGKDGRGNWPSRQEQGEGPSLTAHLPWGDELRDETTRMYGALELIAEAAGRISGRKNLLFFTIGLGETDRFGIYQHDQRFYPQMLEALNDSNVAVYTLDLTPNDVSHTLEGSLSELADDTGGRYFNRFVSFTSPLGQIAQENSGYYLLSYRSERPAGESGFQDVRIKLRDPSLELRAREGYAY